MFKIKNITEEPRQYFDMGKRFVVEPNQIIEVYRFVKAIGFELVSQEKNETNKNKETEDIPIEEETQEKNN